MVKSSIMYECEREIQTRDCLVVEEGVVGVGGEELISTSSTVMSSS